MPLIKPRTRGKHFVRVRLRLEQENFETMHAYKVFIGESEEYVVNQLCENVLAKDREFVHWRVEHPGPHAPQLSRRGRPRTGRRSSTSPVGTETTSVSTTSPLTRAS